MNETNQRIAIATLLGWKLWEFTGTNHDEVWWSDPNGVSKLRDNPPDYLNDLNAMHEAEKVLTTRDASSYCKEIYKITACPEWASFPVIHATAAQRAEAFLRTLNLWKEDK